MRAHMDTGAGQRTSEGIGDASGSGSIGIARVRSHSGRLREYIVAFERTMKVCMCGDKPDRRLHECLACYVSVSGLVGLYASRAAI